MGMGMVWVEFVSLCGRLVRYLCVFAVEFYIEDISQNVC